EVDAVVAGRQPDVADDVVGVRAVEEHHLVVLHDRGRVVDAGGLPAVALRAQDRVRVVRGERSEGELGVRLAHVESLSTWGLDRWLRCGGALAEPPRNLCAFPAEVSRPSPSGSGTSTSEVGVGMDGRLSGG